VPTIPEQLEALAVLDELHRSPEENPPEAPWKEAAGWAAGSGGAGSITSVGWRTIAGFSSGANIAAIHDDTNTAKAEILHAKVRAHTASSGSERFASLYLNVWPAIFGTGEHAYRVRWVRTGTNTWTFTLTEHWSSTEGVVLATVEGVTMVDGEGGEVALRVDKGTQIVSVWVKSEEGAEWEEVASEEAQTELIGYTDAFPWSVGLDAAGNTSRWENIGVGEGEEASEPKEEVVVPVMIKPAIERIHELPPDRMAIRVDAANGTAARWSEDEPAAENALADVVIEDEIPGGWKSVKCSLARDPYIDWRDIEEFAEMKAYIEGVEIVGEGFLDKGPSATGERQAMNPEFLGWQSVLNDNTAAKVGFIDSDLSKWGEPSTQRRANLAGANIPLAASTQTGWLNAGDKLPGVLFDFSGVTSDSATDQAGEAWNDSGGDLIGALLYHYETLKSYDSSTSTYWTDLAHLASDDILSGSYVSGEDHHQVTNSSTYEQIVSSVAMRYAVLKSRHISGASGNQINAVHGWLAPKLLGILATQNLTLQGSWPDVGYTAQQMLVCFINNLAQPLYATDESVDDDGFIIPQAWYLDGGLSSIVDDLVKYALYDWFIYHGKLFEHREPGSYGRFWKAYVTPSELNEVGKDSQRLWRSIVVQYTASDGSTRTVGPPGSNSDTETTKLEITDPAHPAVLAERTRRDLLDLRGIGSAEVATKVGERFLEEATLLNRSGSAKLSGYVMDNHGVLYPTACVKSGDWISFTDSHDTSYRKIVRKSYTHSERSAEIDIDAPPSGLDALLERLQVGLISLGVA